MSVLYVIPLCVAARHAVLPLADRLHVRVSSPATATCSREGRRLGATVSTSGGSEVEREPWIHVLGQANTGASADACRRPRGARGRSRSAARAGRPATSSPMADAVGAAAARGRPMAGMPVEQRQVVHGDDRRRLAILGQPRVEPRQALRAEGAVDAAGIAWCRRRRAAADRSASRSGSPRSVPAAPAGAGSSCAQASRSSWLPASTCTGMVSGDSSSRTRSYSLAEPCSVRSPLTRTAPGAGSSAATSRTAAASRARARVVVVADVRVAQLGEQERARQPSRRRGVGQVAPDVADVEPARDLARAVGDVQVDARDEPGARARADRDVRAELEALAVVGDAVGVRLAAARQLGDVLAPGEPELVGGLAQRARRSRRGRRTARRARRGAAACRGRRPGAGTGCRPPPRGRRA